MSFSTTAESLVQYGQNVEDSEIRLITTSITLDTLLNCFEALRASEHITNAVTEAALSARQSIWYNCYDLKPCRLECCGDCTSIHYHTPPYFQQEPGTFYTPPHISMDTNTLISWVQETKDKVHAWEESHTNEELFNVLPNRMLCDDSLATATQCADMLAKIWTEDDAKRSQLHAQSLHQAQRHRLANDKLQDEVETLTQSLATLQRENRELKDQLHTSCVD
ncbi:hypothetical protein M231_01422 [Tremella mesenterica]|uniref:Uncharacterized protein n=1 Tax=Tremella mesenterica TaxID=5217 RepID=A0A4Q1BTK4_TREME|nr:uncharacterized protein TREMEDRAFT_65217 [Tremella mesenterica DSM 1558]EIW66812.1 hypothetical protein TREMEDRAFT_65217 [Tremella mesenterica DSM 1558]RXK41272.1 hypothetical protein M231_01422 [Tremella mesenterica]